MHAVPSAMRSGFSLVTSAVVACSCSFVSSYRNETQTLHLASAFIATRPPPAMSCWIDGCCGSDDPERHLVAMIWRDGAFLARLTDSLNLTDPNRFLVGQLAKPERSRILQDLAAAAREGEALGWEGVIAPHQPYYQIRFDQAPDKSLAFVRLVPADGGSVLRSDTELDSLLRKVSAALLDVSHQAEFPLLLPVDARRMHSALADEF